MGAAGGGATLDITDVFSTYLYTGNNASQPINNGIDLSGEGGLVWIKWRSGNNAFGHSLHDTERGVTKELHSDSTPAQSTEDRISSFNSTGFSLTSNTETNLNANYYASWTFRKAPKFFDVVTYTGSGSAKTVAHSLGSAPGMIIIKNTSVADPWAVYHRANTAAPQTDYLVLNTSAATVDSAAWWNDTAPTSSVFTVGTDHSVNANNENYVAYIFAHNDGDGEFGPDSDQDIIKCGSYTGNASKPGPSIDLGFEPQWLLVKDTTSANDWFVWDTMRGLPSNVNNSTASLSANTSAAEVTQYGTGPTPTGFQIQDNNAAINASGNTYIYMAIRRGPLAPPEVGTEVFALQQDNFDTNAPAFRSSFPVDFAIERRVNIAASNYIVPRLTAPNFLKTDSSQPENHGGANAEYVFDYSNGWNSTAGQNANTIAYMWGRAPSFCDVVAYTGNGTAGHTVSHNLTVPPEMMWIKERDTLRVWSVYHTGTHATAPEDYNLKLDTDEAVNATSRLNSTAPTSSNFTLGSSVVVNESSKPYIAYLFASLAGVSKVGSYTGNGTDGRTIDCGFTTSARFVLGRRIDGASGWFLFDSVRGITANYDPWLALDNTDAQTTNDNIIKPDSNGFALGEAGHLNQSGGSFIFYAIA